MLSPTTTIRRLYLFQINRATVPTPDGRQMKMSSGCYLAQTSDGQNILIDSGMPANYTRPPQAPRVEFEKTVLEYLADLHLQPGEIHTLICTHFDIDHAGHHDSFPHAELVVQRAHYELARGGHPRFAPARPHWDHPDLHYRLVDGDVELLPGLTLIETSGHVPGHQSVLLRLPQTGPVLLAIDAVTMGAAFTPERHATPLDMDEAQLRASTRKLLQIVEREPVQLTVFHHDGEQWQTLKKAPDYYE